MGAQNVARLLAELERKEQLSNIAAALGGGGAFSTGQHFNGVAAGNAKQLYLENNTTGTALLVLGPTVRAGGSVIAGKAFNPTVTTAGAAPDTGIQSKKSGVSAPANVAVAIGGANQTGSYDITGGDQFSKKQVGGGSTPAAISAGGSGDDGVTNVLMPGDSLLIEATNDSGTTINVSIDVDFVAVEVGELTE